MAQIIPFPADAEEPELEALSCEALLALAQEQGFTVRGLTFSPVRGPEGNIEFLAHLSLVPEGGITPDVPALVRQAHETLKG